VGVGLDVGVDAIRAGLDQFRGLTGDSSCAAGCGSERDRRLRAPSHGDQSDAGGGAAVRFRKVHVVFQPHRYTRTRDLMEEFTTAFGDADSLFVLDIYAASEKPIEGISGEALAGSIRGKGGRSAEYVGSFANAVSAAVAVAEAGDMILTLGRAAFRNWGR